MTHDAETALKPCPFCGGEASTNDGGNSVYGRLWWTVGCVSCGVYFSDQETWDPEKHGYLHPDCKPKECFDVWNTRATLSALPPQEVSDDSDLDAKMISAGMIPLSKMLSGHGEMEKWLRHAHVHTLDDFREWVAMKQREYMGMRMRYEIGEKDKTDDLWQWVFAHAAAFDAVATQLRALSEDTQ